MNFVEALKLSSQILRRMPRPSQVVNAAKFAYNYCVCGCRQKVLRYNPVSVGVFVTFKCNIRCAKCFSRCVNSREFADMDFTVSDFDRLLKSDFSRDAVRVSFVGGEPLVHRDLFEMIWMAHRDSKLTMFPTNALLIGQRIDELAKSPVDAIQISVYNEHKGRQFEAMELLRSKNSKVSVCLSHWVTRETYLEAEDVIVSALDMKANSIVIQNFLPQQGGDPSPDDISSIITDGDSHIIEYFLELKRRYGKKISLSLPSPLVPVSRRHCPQPSIAVFIDRHGNLFPCCLATPANPRYGNIYKDVDVWNGGVFKALRSDFVSSFPVLKECEHCCLGSDYVRPFI
ncbi:Coenzyme PQQ synthesis protein E [Fundidesulfovibrio magnetotacticus]|uniref:Coenzyme PQQ synthesis protein E n=1 Tax=Fundidesulfovibrio magnetotacticus TaxID=2730080 RepID=A0A6V8LLT3_9BACT|nr:radical SAM protein [Fundidesulfovibrio magnetotacticus]GFK92664.1 Coenzyme PQQ synthesis protein E [Fundidesulfovibrio magnetotacticus]